MKKINLMAIMLLPLGLMISCEQAKLEMVDIPGTDIKMSKTEITQKQYEEIMGYNPSYFKGINNPVERVNWYDAVYFCNKLSEEFGFTPVYAIDGKTDVTTWDYIPNEGTSIGGDITQNINANGFRLPTEEEWEYAAKGGRNYRYAGSDNLNEVGWYGLDGGNSRDKTHPVAQKKANDYGLYDMSGNVMEWCWDLQGDYWYRNRGGGYYDNDYECEVSGRSDSSDAGTRSDKLGFRIVCSAFEKPNQIINETKVENFKSIQIDSENDLVKIPDMNIYMMKTEVTQKLYENVMGYNPSYGKGDNNPVENVSWYDAVYFCNELSLINGKTPVYSVHGSTNVKDWGYTPNKWNSINGTVIQDTNANGFRLPTEEEWEYAAKGGRNYRYAGSDNLNEVGWYGGNSEKKTHPVAQKKANGYGLYDMSGNVMEWCWDYYNYNIHSVRGGAYSDNGKKCEILRSYEGNDCDQYVDLGFRVVCSLSD